MCRPPSVLIDFVPTDKSWGSSHQATTHMSQRGRKVMQSIFKCFVCRVITKSRQAQALQSWLLLNAQVYRRSTELQSRLWVPQDHMISPVTALSLFPDMQTETTSSRVLTLWHVDIAIAISLHVFYRKVHRSHKKSMHTHVCTHACTYGCTYVCNTCMQESLSWKLIHRLV